MAFTAFGRQRSLAKAVLLVGGGILFQLASASPGHAAYTYDASTGVLKIVGTGQGSTSTTTQVDPNWKVIAMANGQLGNPTEASPGNFYIPTSVLPTVSTPSVWYDGVAGDSNTINAPSNGVGMDSLTTYRWGAYQAVTASYFKESPASPNICGTAPGGSPACSGSPDYNFIVQTDFTVSQAGSYVFAYNASADNRYSIYLNGSVDTSTPWQPTISGGTYLGGTIVRNGNKACPGGLTANCTGQDLGPKFLTNGAYAVVLAAGSYKLNYVVTDYLTPGSGYGDAGLLISTTTFTKVPGPLPVMGAAVFFAHSRRLRRKISVLSPADAS